MQTLRGFTLIEIAITLAVLGVVITLGLPTFTTWINNQKIRTAAEGITNGLQLARAEAVRRNHSVTLTLGDGTGLTAWIATDTGAGAGAGVIQYRSGAEGTIANVNIGFTPLVTPSGSTPTVTFNGMGRVTTNGSGTSIINQIDVCSSALADADMRKMRILISSAGNVRMCDLQVPNTSTPPDPRSCPGVNPRLTSAC